MTWPTLGTTSGSRLVATSSAATVTATLTWTATAMPAQHLHRQVQRDRRSTRTTSSTRSARFCRTRRTRRRSRRRTCSGGARAAQSFSFILKAKVTGNIFVVDTFTSSCPNAHFKSITQRLWVFPQLLSLYLSLSIHLSFSVLFHSILILLKMSHSRHLFIFVS